MNGKLSNWKTFCKVIETLAFIDLTIERLGFSLRQCILKGYFWKIPGIKFNKIASHAIENLNLWIPFTLRFSLRPTVYTFFISWPSDNSASHQMWDHIQAIKVIINLRGQFFKSFDETLGTEQSANMPNPYGIHV